MKLNLPEPMQSEFLVTMLEAQAAKWDKLVEEYTLLAKDDVRVLVAKQRAELLNARIEASKTICDALSVILENQK